MSADPKMKTAASDKQLRNLVVHFILPAFVLIGFGFILGWVIGPVVRESIDPSESNSSAGMRTEQGHSGFSIRERSGTAAKPGEVLAGLSQAKVTYKVRMILRESDPVKRNAAFLSLLADADMAGLKKIREATKACYKDGWNTRDVGSAVGQREGKLMGKEGMDQLPAEPNGLPSFTMKDRLRGWASDDPAAVKAWLDELEPGRMKEQLVSEWLGGMRDAEPGKLLELLPELTPKQQDGLMGTIVNSAVAQNGLEGMSDWFRVAGAALPEASRNRAYMLLVDSFTQSYESWTRAVDFMKQASSPEQVLFARGLQQMAWRSSRYDPRKTLELLDEFAPQNQFLSAGRDQYISQCMAGASTSSIFVIEAWLDGNTNSPIYNDVVRHYLSQNKSLDPSAAMARAQSVTDPALRQKLMSSLSAPEH